MFREGPPGGRLPGNLNQLYTTNNAAAGKPSPQLTLYRLFLVLPWTVACGLCDLTSI